MVAQVCSADTTLGRNARGERELARVEEGKRVIEDVIEQRQDCGKVEVPTQKHGRRLIGTITPLDRQLDRNFDEPSFRNHRIGASHQFDEAIEAPRLDQFLRDIKGIRLTEFVFLVVRRQRRRF